MSEGAFGIILDIIGEVLTASKPKNNDLKNIKENNSYNLTHNNNIDIFNIIKDYNKKRVNKSAKYSEKTGVVTQIVGLDPKRGTLGYTENGTGKLIEINKSTY